MAICVVSLAVVLWLTFVQLAATQSVPLRRVPRQQTAPTPNLYSTNVSISDAHGLCVFLPSTLSMMLILHFVALISQRSSACKLNRMLLLTNTLLWYSIGNQEFLVLLDTGSSDLVRRQYSQKFIEILTGKQSVGCVLQLHTERLPRRSKLQADIDVEPISDRVRAPVFAWSSIWGYRH